MNKYPPSDEIVTDHVYWRKWYMLVLEENLNLRKENESLKRQLQNYQSEVSYYKKLDFKL